MSHSVLITLTVLSLFPAQNPNVLNTAVLTGHMVSVPVKTLAVEADGSVTDVTNYTSCKSTEDNVLKVTHAPLSLNGLLLFLQSLTPFRAKLLTFKCLENNSDDPGLLFK